MNLELKRLIYDFNYLIGRINKAESIPEETIKKYSEAMKLAKECGDKLNSATEAVNKILSENGSLEDFKIDESSN